MDSRPVRAQLVEAPISPAALMEGFATNLDAASGAVVSFTGLARGHGKDGQPITRLFLEHHPVLTERSLRSIAQDGAARFAVERVEVVHRAGSIAPGEAIVWVAVAAAHRRAAFEAADYLMDRLKTEAVFWKREDGEAGSAWIEPTDADHHDRGRWE